MWCLCVYIYNLCACFFFVFLVNPENVEVQMFVTKKSRSARVFGIRRTYDEIRLAVAGKEFQGRFVNIHSPVRIPNFELLQELFSVLCDNFFKKKHVFLLLK